MNLQKENGYGGDVPATSLMLKLAKRMEKVRKKIGAIRIAYLFLMESFSFILEFLLDFWKDNLVMSVVESLLPYQRSILLYFQRDNITNLMINLTFLTKDQFFFI